MVDWSNSYTNKGAPIHYNVTEYCSLSIHSTTALSQICECTKPHWLDEHKVNTTSSQPLCWPTTFSTPNWQNKKHRIWVGAILFYSLFRQIVNNTSVFSSLRCAIFSYQISSLSKMHSADKQLYLYKKTNSAMNACQLLVIYLLLIQSCTHSLYILL